MLVNFIKKFFYRHRLYDIYSSSKLLNAINQLVEKQLRFISWITRVVCQTGDVGGTCRQSWTPWSTHYLLTTPIWKRCMNTWHTSGRRLPGQTLASDPVSRHRERTVAVQKIQGGGLVAIGWAWIPLSDCMRGLSYDKVPSRIHSSLTGGKPYFAASLSSECFISCVTSGSRNLDRADMEIMVFFCESSCMLWSMLSAK